ncbi:amino acid ABC transporter permease [Rothia sp. AR01]|uniref:Amino acid ABC transporter permease n=1 Tax=Rothia santali TaxID=2949643 RepID=A0A9X2HEQ2_9MICC|nr:amino acid ABC transporter permease [Rothia santali]MCP3426945.1 amino acid ABC transporter permease [Rothia santali]
MVIFDIFTTLLQGVKYTLLVSFAAFFLGALIAVPVTAARRSRYAFVRGIGTAYVELLRGIPPLPWLFIVFFGLPSFGVILPPIQSGILVFGLVGGAYLTEIYRSGFRAVPNGQVEAGEALGVSRFYIYVKILIPQAVRTMLPLAIAYLIGLLKDSAIVSIVGVQDISALSLVENRSSSDGLLVFIVASAMYLILSVPIGIFGRWLGVRLTGRRKRTPEPATVTEAVMIR